MAKYKCAVCGYIYDEKAEGKAFDALEEGYTCPLCRVSKAFFEKQKEEVINNNFDKAVKICENNVSIQKDYSKCINCGVCKAICLNKMEKDFGDDCQKCINCGQCILSCPKGALTPKHDIDKFENAKKTGKICIAYTSPAVRVAFGDIYKMEAGTFLQDKMIGLLRMMGFNYVFDVSFGADLTIMEEAAELIQRIKSGINLPQLTSCCPAWVKYAEQYFPQILKNISTCKSPIGMMGPIVKKYFSKENNLHEEDLFAVAITPCTAKKFEITRPQQHYTDLVLTLNEIGEYIKKNNIKYEDIPSSNYDSFIAQGSGAGIIFGNSGGVMEAAIRTANFMLTGKNLEDDALKLESVRGVKTVKEATVDIDGIKLNLCVIQGMNDALPILDDIVAGKSKYHFIEVMNCDGGCIGGGGQPRTDTKLQQQIREKRIASLYKKDEKCKIRFCHENPQIKKVYAEFLGEPLSEVSHNLLHTTYIDRTKSE